MGAKVSTQVATATATGTLVAVPCTLHSIVMEGAATAGTVVVRDGGAGGAVKLTLATAAGAGAEVQLDVPAEGLVFATDAHVTISTTVRVTAFYSTP
jgi:hypothetical protein